MHTREKVLKTLDSCREQFSQLVLLNLDGLKMFEHNELYGQIFPDEQKHLKATSSAAEDALGELNKYRNAIDQLPQNSTADVLDEIMRICTQLTSQVESDIERSQILIDRINTAAQQKA